MDSTDLFEILVREQLDGLDTFLRASGADHALRDEVIQETVVIAWQTLDRYDRNRPFGAWFRGIAKRTLLSARTKKPREPTLDPAVIELVADRFDALNGSRAFEEEMEALGDCLERLPIGYRESIDARYHEGLRGRSFADRLGTTLDNARKRLQRARRLLHHCIQKAMGGTA